MQHFAFTRALALAALFAAVSVPASSLAQSGYPSVSDPRLQYKPSQPSYEELKREYDSIKIWAPITGIPVSYFAMSGGFAMILASQIEYNFCFTEAPCPHYDDPMTRSERALAASGAVVAAVGLAGLVASSVRLRRKNTRRRRLRYEMGRFRFGGT